MTHLLLMILSLMSSPVFAQTVEDDGFQYKPPGGLVSQDTPVASIFNNISGWLITFIGAVAVIFVIIGGIQYATAMGDQEKINGAKRTLTWATLGVVLAILSYIIVPLIAKLFQ